MKKLLPTSVVMFFLLTGMGSIAHADFYSKNIYIVGSSPDGLAKDPNGDLTVVIDEYGVAHEGGVALITWNFDVEKEGWATLTITAEGVDGGLNAPNGGERDAVSFNGLFLGNLEQQDFYSPSYKLQPGFGNLPGITEITETSFLNVWANAGINTVTIIVDPNSWVNEIETSTLTVTSIPEPTTMLLFGTGLACLAAVGRRKRI